MDPSLQTALVLAADDPQAQASFYGALIGSQPMAGQHPRHWRLPWPAGGWLEIYGPSRSRPQPRGMGRLALCLQRTAAAADVPEAMVQWIAHAEVLGAQPLEAPRQEPFGLEAWLLDPEDNRLLLLLRSSGGA